MSVPLIISSRFVEFFLILFKSNKTDISVSMSKHKTIECSKPDYSYGYYYNMLHWLLKKHVFKRKQNCFIHNHFIHHCSNIPLIQYILS